MIRVDKVWVVTGGGSGIGRELVLQLLAQGASVANVDTNAEGLKETARLAGEKKYNLSSHILDITDRESVRTLPKEVIKRHGAVDGIINNARMDQALKPVQELEYEQIEEIMNINFYGMVNMVRAFLPHLLLRTTSYIVNVSNMRGLIPCSGQAVFSASMGAVKLFTEGLSAELKGSPVKVAIIYPGAIHTNIMVNSGLESPIDQTVYKKEVKALTPEKAANIIIKAIERDKSQGIMVGKDARSLDLLYRLSPQRAVNLVEKEKGKTSS
ncbi:MAG: SDR family NAD(P)-dependent oxidoreductase [Bacteroidia bacterium]